MYNIFEEKNYFKNNIGSKTQENPNFNPKTQKQTQNPDTCQKPRFTKSGFQKPKMATLANRLTAKVVGVVDQTKFGGEIPVGAPLTLRINVRDKNKLVEIVRFLNYRFLNGEAICRVFYKIYK